MAIDLTRFGYQSGAGGTSVQMSGSFGSPEQGDSQSGGLFDGVTSGLKNAGKNIANLGKNLFVSDSVGDPSITQTILTAGQTGNPETSFSSSDSSESSQPDELKAIEPGAARAQPTEMENLTAYEKLLSAGVPYADIAYVQSKGDGTTLVDMANNYDRGLAIDGGQPNNSGMSLQMQRQIEELSGRFESQGMGAEQQYARNGVSATVAGAETAVKSAQMMVG